MLENPKFHDKATMVGKSKITMVGTSKDFKCKIRTSCQTKVKMDERKELHIGFEENFKG